MNAIIRISSVAIPLLLAATAASADTRRFGVMVDAGVPDGANGSIVYRPWSFLRLHAGAGTNFAAPGVRGGLALMPFGAGYGLSLNAEAGRAFSGDAQPLARMITGDDSLEVAALRDLSYDYANLRLGFEAGTDPVTFYIQGGMSYIRGSVKNAAETLTSLGETTTFSFESDPKVRMWTPSVRVGLIVYFMH